MPSCNSLPIISHTAFQSEIARKINWLRGKERIVLRPSLLWHISPSSLEVKTVGFKKANSRNSHVAGKLSDSVDKSKNETLIFALSSFSVPFSLALIKKSDLHLIFAPNLTAQKSLAEIHENRIVSSKQSQEGEIEKGNSKSFFFLF